MSGEIDLSVLLASMAAELVPGRFVFGTAVDPQLARDVEAVATVGETEGLSLVTTQHQADRVGLTYDFVAGWITLRVHPALEAVGLTAAVSTALASAGISCKCHRRLPPRSPARADRKGRTRAAHPAGAGGQSQVGSVPVAVRLSVTQARLGRLRADPVLSAGGQHYPCAGLRRGPYGGCSDCRRCSGHEHNCFLEVPRCRLLV